MSIPTDTKSKRLKIDYTKPEMWIQNKNISESCSQTVDVSVFLMYNVFIRLRQEPNQIKQSRRTKV